MPATLRIPAAALLAATAPSPDPAELALILAVDGNAYAIPLADVVEVTRAVAVTTPSGDSGSILGYIDLRGDLVPVVSGRSALGLASRDLELSDRFVVVRASGRLAAIQVDGVAGVEPIVAANDQSAASRAGLTVTRRSGDTQGSAVVTRLDVARLIPDIAPAGVRGA